VAARILGLLTAVLLVSAWVPTPATLEGSGDITLDGSGDITITDPASGQEVQIVFDRYGVGHVFADSTTAAMYGLGYLHATQKLWLMHLVRLVFTGNLGDLLGPAGTPTDRTTMHSLQLSREVRDERYARLPQDVKDEFEAFAAGVNRYLDEALLDPNKVPNELILLGQWPVRPWVPDDSFAGFIYTIADPVGGVPALRNTALLARLVETYGQDEGLAKFEDLVRSQDPDQPTTVPRDYNYRAVKPVLDEKQLAEHRFLVPDARYPNDLDGPDDGAGELPEPETADAPGGALEQLALAPSAESLERALADVEASAADAWPLDLEHLFGSNAQIVAPHLSATGNSLLTSGPQTVYNAPAIYYQFGVHVPGVWDWTGVGAPALHVPFAARTTTHAWTVTSGLSADYVDWYVERLNPDNPREYLFRGEYEPMACRTHQHTVRGVPTETQEICHTRHGLVYSIDAANGVAYSQRRPYTGREEQLLLAFRDMTRATDVIAFGTGAMRMPTTWNFFYADDVGNAAYWYSGYHPKRRGNVDLRFVMDGTGKHEWIGVVPPRHVPHAINPPRGWMGSWNNAPAGDWPQAYTQPAQHRYETVMRAYADGSGTAAPFAQGGVNPDDGLWDPADLWRNLQHAAYAQHHWTFRSALPDPSSLATEQARRARDLVAAWDGLRVDRDGDGRADDAAFTIADRWLSIAGTQAFTDDLPSQDLSLARPNGELWHVLSPDSTATMQFDWLNGESRETFAARTFQQAVDELAASRGSTDPAEWRSGVGITRYTHFTALHLALDTVRPTDCNDLSLCLTDFLRDEVAPPVVNEGYVAPHHRMNRGVFNGTVAYLDPPGEAGGSRVQACSVLTPGIDGHIGPDGHEGPHFQDQVPLYVGWKLHDWPVTRTEVEAARSNEFCDPLEVASR